MVCFVHFDFEMCFAPQRRALFRHLNCQKWSENGVFCTFWLRNVLCATTACNFSSLVWPAGSAPAALASLLFDPPEPQMGASSHWKNRVFGDFPTFSRICIFFLLTLSLLLFSLLIFLFSLPLPCSAFHLSILSEVWLLNFLRQLHNYTPLHSTTLHYTTFHYTTLHYTPLHYTPLHYTTLHYTTLPSTTLQLHFTTSHCTTLHNTTTTTTQLHSTTLHCAKLHYTKLHYTTLHSTTLHCTTLHYTPLPSTTLHYTTIRYATLHSTTLQLQLHSTTLHYTEWHCTTDRQVDR